MKCSVKNCEYTAVHIKTIRGRSIGFCQNHYSCHIRDDRFNENNFLLGTLLNNADELGIDLFECATDTSDFSGSGEDFSGGGASGSWDD